jgi:hypothetical protein
MMHDANRGAARRLLIAAGAALLTLAALGGALVAGIATQPRSGARAAAAPLPTSLPGHFSFGIMDSPGGTGYLNAMRANNGTAWDFRYQYLAGGVNTGSGWETWNSPAGAFATYYLQDSGANNYTPGLVYYEMEQSNGSCNGCGETQRALSNLGNPNTMAAYYANWALLMQQIGAYGKPALVIVEPDLWGFIEQAASGQGGSAANVAASVASSGNADAAAFPNSAQGFAWALLHIRDRYARNAVLALHASPWSTGADIGSDTSTTVDATAVGAKQAQFLQTAGLAGNPSGVSTFDVLSSDVADHDSGQSGIWWDRNNVTFPNFTRYLQYAASLSAGAARRILMWQVPVGNQYFDTLDNSQGHTQDNRAEYILGHIADFAAAGIIGVLFGPGNGGTTVVDARNDGITNPAPISTYECARCNTHTSAYADDDGGYLRVFLGQYYKAGAYVLTTGGTSPTATSTPVAPTATNTPVAPTATNTPVAPTATSTPAPTATAPATCAPTITFGAASATPNPASAGATIAVTAHFTASCATSGLVDFEVYNDINQQVWQTWQDNQTLSGSAQSFTAQWTVPASQANGLYYLKVGVFAPGWAAFYGWQDAGTITVAPAAAAPAPVTITGVPCTVTLPAGPQSGACSGTFTPAG